jgi:predicted AlkP superfamily pyrophosphatase or phosphodiesterase
MKVRAWFGASMVAALLAVSLVSTDPPAQERPTLVVVIVVDQLRADLIQRYSPAFEGGFRRLLDEGYQFTSASQAHAVTHTAAGHATLSTGVFPSRSGIVANDWSQRRGDAWSPMYAVQDADSPILGVEGLTGRSPRNLLRPGLADWVLAADPDARVVSLSGKDRAAITLAGQTRGEVFWMVPELGRFVTSTYYRTEYPGWVQRVNAEIMPQILADSTWVQSVDERFRHLARPDSAPYEGDGIHTTFPHLASEEVAWTDSTAMDPIEFNTWALAQPRLDHAVAELARRAIDELDLGQRGSVDYLAVSFSATDYVGHRYGPLSQEQLDNLVRLDRELGGLLDQLDQRVGRERWVLGLSADHGVMDMPEWTAQNGGTASRTSLPELQQGLVKALREAAAEGTEPPYWFAQRLATLLRERGLVAEAYTTHDLTVGEPSDSFGTLMRNSYYPGRAPGWLTRYGVEMRFGYDQLVHAATGTTHGSPYWYDRHVPLILLGPGVTPGQSDEAAYTVDFAPTLAALVGIPVPDDLDGRALHP